MDRIPKLLLSSFHALNMDFQYEEHPPVATVAESQTIKQTIPWIHTKNLFLTNTIGKRYLVSLEANTRLPINQLRKLLGEKELTFGHADDLKEKLGLLPWSVSIFGLIHKPKELEVILDATFIDQPSIWRHPNRNDATITISYTDAHSFILCCGYTPKHIAIPSDTSNNQLKLW
jgi:Ala-tRNA(Pro) deacylase